MTQRRKTNALGLVLAMAFMFGKSRAHAEEPSDATLTIAGLAMAIPTYPLVLMGHEGSHALMAKVLGANIVDYRLLPGRHPRTKRFFFGYVSVTGLDNKRDKALFYTAPKMTNMAMLGMYSLLNATGSLPANSYLKLATLVFFTGEWIDFSRDIIAFWSHNDTVKFYNILGLDTEWKRLPARAVHLTLSAAFAYALVKGFDELFDKNQQGQSSMLAMPIFSGHF